MTALQITGQSVIPDLDGFETYYGVPISCIGEDGDVVALGHVEPRRFIAAHLRYCREFLGFDLARESASRHAAEGIEHIWMVNDPEGAKAEGAAWYLGAAKPDDAGAFPATYWSC